MVRTDIKGKNIFITGGSGFIGSWLIESLVDCNKIWCYDNCRRLSPKFTKLLGHKNLKFIKGDIRDKAKLKKSLPNKLDTVLHLAAIAGVSSYYKIPFDTISVNLIGTYNLLEAIKNRDMEIFIDFSTSEVYGIYAKNVTEEDQTIQGPISDPRWTYAISKLASEELSHCYHRQFKMPIVSVRPFNVYGPFQIGEGAIRIFINSALKNEKIYIDGNGSQVRAWCYIEDFLEGVFLCIKKKRLSSGNVFNIGNPAGSATITDLAKKIIKISGSDSKIYCRKEARTDIKYRVPDISKAKKMLGFKPNIGLGEGLRRTIAWYRANLG